MIFLYTGTPGSGKSYHATQCIDIRLKFGKDVIANFPIKLNKNHKGKFTFVPTTNLTVDFLLEYFRENHVERKESQTLVIIDEASILFNTRGFDVKERVRWLEFLSVSRHYGFDIMLITQQDRAIDRQVRGLIEYNFKHRKLSGYGIKGWLLIAIFRKKYICVKTWYVINEKCGQEFFNIKKKVANLYDTFAMFEKTDGKVEKKGGAI